MFRLIVLLRVSNSLAQYQTKGLFLNYEPCIVRPNLINMNPFEAIYYPFMNSLNQCSESCNFLISKNMHSKRNKRHTC